MSDNANLSTSRLEPTTRLARRVLGGEVVFFVGSGFSIDSEGNSADRLVGRLLAGLLAMGTVLTRTPATDAPAREVLRGLGQVFGIEGLRSPGEGFTPAQVMTTANVKLLSREYYNFNEWSVSALTVLSGALLTVPAPGCDEMAAEMQRIGSELLRSVGDLEPLDAIDCRALGSFISDAARGKALFLDLMGFSNCAVMAGRPHERDVEAVVRSYEARLRPRHHALARLAREGVASTIVTTNYDLLLEGAYRLAGFVERDSGEAAAAAASPRYTCIAGADQFFARGEGQRNALLLKIHGSAGAYREVRDLRLKAISSAPKPARRRRTADPWSAYLPALVFTYHEIQSWRADAWSRDLIRTLLRTNTLALCGYSGADPVMHATFREVYEERAGRARGPGRRRRDASDAPAFFFGFTDRREFHALEILRAATDAAGCRAAKLVDHPNQIEFERADGFPTIDDHFRWIVHCVIRELQAQGLTSRLRRLAPRLLQHPCPDADFVRLRDRFDALVAAEQQIVAAAADSRSQLTTAARRRTFESVVDWTWHFVPGLLRELALAEAVESRQGPGRAVRETRAFPSYQPAVERLEWSAWAAIIELALRRMVGAWRHDLTGAPGGDPSRFSAEDSPHAAVSFSRGDERQPYALCIRLGGFERYGRSPALTGAFRRVTCWEFDERDVPWPLEPRLPCPPPPALWSWAAGLESSVETAARYLGVEP